MSEHVQRQIEAAAEEAFLSAVDRWIEREVRPVVMYHDHNDVWPAQLVGQINPAQLQDDKQFRRIEGIINSMTPQERAKPELIKASRKRRIAAGAGVPVQAVNQLLNQFEQMQKMMKMMKGGNLARMMRGMKGMLPGPR